MAQDAADQAYAAAVQEIRRVASIGEPNLYLSGGIYRALQQIPEEITNLEALESLAILETAVSDLSPIAGLKRLEVLKLGLTRTSDLSPLAALAELEVLTLNQTDVSDLTSLHGLTSLQLLHLNQTAVSDLSPIAGLTALQELSLVQTSVSDLSPLVRLAALRLIVLSQTSVNNLAPLAGLSSLTDIRLDQTKVSDVSPLAGLTPLEGLDLDGSLVSDLRPLLRLNRMKASGVVGLTFRDTPATAQDSELAQLAEISDSAIRGRQTLAYLATLPPWPEPYTPSEKTDGRSPRPSVATTPSPADHPALFGVETQIAHLLRQAVVTRVTAVLLSDQIALALHGLPATEGNQLPPVLQLLSEFGEVLSMLGRAHVDDRDEEQNLRLRVAQLEAIVERLTAELRDAEAARLAAEALAKKDGFIASFRKASGTAAGAGTIALVGVGVPTAAVYFLGADHPLVHAFLTVVGRLPK